MMRFLKASLFSLIFFAMSSAFVPSVDAQNNNRFIYVTVGNAVCLGTGTIDVQYFINPLAPSTEYRWLEVSGNSRVYGGGVNLDNAYGTGTQTIFRQYSIFTIPLPAGSAVTLDVTLSTRQRQTNTFIREDDRQTLTFICDTGQPTTDSDRDNIPDNRDNCRNSANFSQLDSDGDGIGDVCDNGQGNQDPDNDGVPINEDACPLLGDEGYGVQENGCPPHIVEPPDDRINWQMGDTGVVIYNHEEGVAVYCHDGNTWLAMHVTLETVAFAPTVQSQDIPVMEYNEYGCHVAFYILDSGEYQINIYSQDGKLYELIADSVFFTDATTRYYDPNE